MPPQFTVPLELRLRYLERKQEELIVCRSQLETREFEAVRVLAHQMRGNAQNFEFPLLEQLGILLETAVENKDVSHAKLILNDVQQAINGLTNRLTKVAEPAV